MRVKYITPTRMPYFFGVAIKKIYIKFKKIFFSLICVKKITTTKLH